LTAYCQKAVNDELAQSLFIEPVITESMKFLKKCRKLQIGFVIAKITAPCNFAPSTESALAAWLTTRVA
jgi:hypothetical protein